MDPNLFLAQLVGFSCLLTLFRAHRTPPGWIVVAIALLGILGVTWQWWPAQAGWISATVWGLFFFIPGLLLSQVNRYVAAEQFVAAQPWAMVLRILHPADGLWDYPTLLKALALGQQGQMDTAIALFQRFQPATSPLGRTATVLLYRLGARWDELLAWMQSQSSAQDQKTETTVSLYYLRSLGETGHLSELVRVFERMAPILERNNDITSLNLARLYLFVFCGWTDPVYLLLEGPLRSSPESVRQFWLLSAALAARNDSARSKLEQLRPQVDAMQQQAIDWRLSHPMANPRKVLLPADQRLLQRVNDELQKGGQYDSRQLFRTNQPTPATYGLIACNVIVFGVTIALFSIPDALTTYLLSLGVPEAELSLLPTLGDGDGRMLFVLYYLGAMVPDHVLAGEWWRVLSSTFLHFGALHLLSNMFGLYLLGRFVEVSLGSARFLFIYLVCGMGSMLCVAMHSLLVPGSAEICVGASGAIMSLLGVMGMIFLRGWQRERSHLAARQFRLILVMIALQTVFDLLNPQISFVGHISGLILGAIVGGAIVFTRRSR